jgi:predicted nucleic-acid-binding protein
MIGFDTNVIVRYVMQDDPKQSPKATKIVESLTVEDPGFISLVALIEFVWVLGSCYDLDRNQVGQAVNALLRTKELVLDRAERAAQALRLYHSGTADFADCLIERCSSNAGCAQTMTFDKSAVKATGMTLVS